MSSAMMPVSTPPKSHHTGPMVDAWPLSKIVYEVYATSGLSWTRLSMLCGVSVDTLRAVAYGRKSYVQQRTLIGVRKLLDLLPDGAP